VRFPIEDEDGKKRFYTKTFAYKRQAQDHLQTLQDARKSGEAVVESDQTLSDFFAEYLAATDVRERTRQDYQQHFNRYIKPKLGKAKLKDITPRRVQNLYNSLKKTLSPRTVLLTHSILHSSLDHAVSLRLIRTNPSSDLKLPRKQESEIRFLQGDEIKEILKQIKASKYSPFFEFMLATGTRPGEARAVMWKDLDFKKGKVKIRRTVNDARPWVFSEPKTKQGKRTLSLPEKTVEMLKELKEAQDKQRDFLDEDFRFPGYVFTDSNGDLLDRRNLISKHLKPALKRVADEVHDDDEEAYERVCGCNLYSLRHSFATAVLEKGTNLKTLSTLLGHKSVELTISTYIHVTEGMEEEAVQHITEVLYS